ncbi:hypothetical protein PFAG_06109, partial [Plasmodium falciparum Santa Lucia]
MGGGSGGGGSSQEQDESAKHMFDRIGKEVHDKVKGEAETYKEALKGDLSKATYPNDRNSTGSTPQDPCKLDYQYHTNVTSGFGREYPCRGKDTVRFSDTQGSECDDRKIRDSEKKSNYGACAPYRRLHLCDRNLENINDYSKINNTHNLLLEVSLAAKHEGEMITGYYPIYQTKYKDSPSEMCTMLARSFADIGDIIRGKDLYRGNNKENKQREKLEKNLKDIFGDIYNELTRGKQNGQALQARYKKDDDNYYQLREDWWTANRATVWKAITCGTHEGDTYFRPTCSDNRGPSQAHHYCRCNDDQPNADKPNTDPPTYFDYVPQFLRWFEEWAEDFCRKRKHKLQNAIKICRGENGADRYCDLNGYDCTRTAKGENKRFSNDECYKCSLPCDHF